MHRHRLVLAVTFGTFVALGAPYAAPAPPPGDAVSGGGIADVLDDFGGFFGQAGTFGLAAGLQPDGTPFGQINFVFRGDFAAAWGACPYDPRCVPNTATNVFHLSGPVTGVVGDAGWVEISGLLSEIDHGRGDGVIFEEFDVPFVITFQEGSSSFVFQWCLLPPFTVDAHGGLRVNGTASAAILAAPGRSQGSRSPSVRPVAGRTPLARQCTGQRRA